MDISDAELVQKIKIGDAQAFETLLDRYEPKISRYIKKFLYDSEDCVDLAQEVFLKVYINIQSFDDSKPFSPWIYRIAHNEAINFLRKKKPDSYSLFDVDVLFPHPIAKEKSDTGTEHEMIKTMLDSVLSEIDAKYREVLILYFYEELSYKEISQVLHIPVTTVGVRITRGKEKVHQKVTEKGLHI